MHTKFSKTNHGLDLRSLTTAGKRAGKAQCNRRSQRNENDRSRIYESELLEQRRLLTAVIASPDPVVYDGNVSDPLAPEPGHSFYVSGNNAQGNSLSQWANASAITPNTTNDLVMNVSAMSTNYVACCEAAGGTLGANLLTNGITQTQTAPAPNASMPAIGDGGASDPSNNANVVSSSAGPLPFFTYELGSAGGATPSANGYTLSEIDVISGHQDGNGQIFAVDVLVEPVGSSQFLSLSGGQGFSLTSVPNGQGGTIGIGKGSTQMAIVNSTAGQPLAQNIQAVKLLVEDSTTFFREFVVTGTPTATLPTAPSAPSAVTANTASAGSTVLWAGSTNAIGYTVLRSGTVNGTYLPVGSVVGPTSFIDATAQPNSTYYYEVTASGNGDSAPSNPSSAATTANFGATAYLFQSELWQGTPGIVENFPQINYFGGQQASSFPVAQGFNANNFSAFVDGKITTDLAGSYTFVVHADDDGYLYVNGQLVSGSVHAQANPYITLPISLAADTAYNFVFLEDQLGGSWGFNMSWQEPTANGAAGPLTVVPATHLIPNADPPPVPQQVNATVLSSNAIQISWNPANDATSYGYVIERAWSDPSGNPTSSFSVVGQVFSGPTTAGAPGAPAWGATSFVDTNAAANTLYVYKVGAITPGQSAPTNLSLSTRAVALPPGATASLSNGTLNITEGAANDGVFLWSSGAQMVVAEGSGQISQTAIFSAPLSSVNSIYVSGISSGYQSLSMMSPFSFSGPVTISQLNDAFVNAALFASQITVVASNNIGINASVTTAGSITLDADSDMSGSGSLAVASGAAVNSGGNPIYVHAAALALSGTINAGGGNILYSLWPLSSISGLFSNTVCSGTVTIAQATTAAIALSGIVGPTLSGSLVLDFPDASFSTTGLDASASNDSIQITASSIITFGAVNAGTGSLTLDATNVTLGAAVNAGSVIIPAYSHVAVDGATMSVAGNISNAGALVVGVGSIVNCAGAVTGSGNSTVGLPAGSGTVAYYRFEGTAGTAATGTGSIVDSSGNGLNGTPSNGPVYSSSVASNPVPVNGDPNATSLSFNGNNQAVYIPDNPDFQITQSLTLEAYIYALPTAGGQGQIIFRGDDRGGYDPYFLTRGLRGNNIVSFAVTNAANQSAEVDATIPLSQWVHVAGTLDDATGQMRIYVNGVLVSSTVTTIRPFAILTSAEPGLGIGNLQAPTLNEPFDGMIDEARISNVALTPSQFLDAPQRPSGASMTVGSFSQSAVSIGPAGKLSIAPSASPSGNVTNSLNIAGGGTMDLANNTLTINYSGQSDPVANVRSYLASGYNNGAWNGTGIVSSVAAGNSNRTTAIGYADSADGIVALPANTIELKYTLYGDTGLTGTVGFTDFMRMTQHYTLNSGATWSEGDFNYDGSVNAADFSLLESNYGQTLPAPALTLTPVVAPPVTSGRAPRVATIPPPAAPIVSVESTATTSLIPTLTADSTKTKSHSGKVKHSKKR